ncbi:hypothetical protein KJI95_09395 [Shewanella sp. JM162201]|uniref:Phage infection protein n=1 Tax=Shewanella jiangmenensis TaxID=2837387 RepID=A0ABS5V2Q0_9GAMM|nr:hypothetical protein [Shewanella jiangmenensis]MBT1444734.1 hypothetical protein [Shewanella jiangmenensis]
MKVQLDLANCYGINQLSKELNFSKTAKNDGVNSLYAPNGTLKTSLAKTFKDVEAGKPTSDLIFPSRTTTRDIKIDGVDISAEQVLVIDSYNESYSSQQVSTLLVNEELKQQYETALKEVDGKRKTLLTAVASASGKRDAKELLSEVFSRPLSELLPLLVELAGEEHPDFTHYGQIKFDLLFNPKVIQLVTSADFGQDLAEYVSTYDRLIESSTVLSKSFNHQKADNVSKSLTENGFFSASHSVNISINGTKQEISSKKELNELLQAEQEKILENPELKEKFSRVDSQLKNKETQTFRDFITDNQHILLEYSDVNQFKQKVLLGYLQSAQTAWVDLVGTYQSNQELVSRIVEEAKEEQTIWETVVDTFNKRFNVPFKLSVDNQVEVILNDAAPTIKFEFDDGRGESEIVGQSSLLEALSQGEKRALYILNVLFEIEARRQSAKPILIVIDDIADSFDYKNKYAIVEYLRDIAKVSHFYLLMLTHNFDFHRIVSSRLGVQRSNRHMATKSSTEISLNPEKYQNDVFNAWKQDLGTNPHYLLASIPFARNLAEYCGYEEHFGTLTSLLHLKADTKDIKISDIQAMYREIFTDKATLELPGGTDLVFNKIIEASDVLTAAPQESPDLESKVILAMAIRLSAEDFMINKIAEPEFVASIRSNQTRVLFDKYVNLYPGECEIIALLDQVNLMTPENIHLNSFMYEPILDMSAHSLYRLYSGLKNLL